MAFDINRLRTELAYSNTATVPELLADLGRLRHFDTGNERLKETWRSRAVAFGGFAAVALVAAVVLAGELPAGGGAVLATVGGGLFLGLVYSGLQAAGLGRMDLEDRRYQLASRILHRLRKDLAPDEPVALEIDFHPTASSKNLTGTGQVGEWQSDSYASRWLSLQARLLDGTHLRIGMEQRLQLRQRTRRNPRGKYKTKRKTKGHALLHVQLRVKPERYPQLARLGGRARAAVRLPKGVSLGRLEVSEDRLLLRASMDMHWEGGENTQSPSVDAPRTVLMMLLSLYQVLNYSSALRKREAARASP